MDMGVSSPKKVPAERMDVMSELCELVSDVASGPSIMWIKTFEPVTPLMYPES